MTSFTIPPGHSSEDDKSSPLSVNCIPDLSKDQLLRFPAFNIWLSTLQRSLARQRQQSHEFHKDPYVLRKIDIQAVDFFKGGRLGFIKLKAEVSNGNGETLPGSVFLRGGSVGMLVRAFLPYSNPIFYVSADLIFFFISVYTYSSSSNQTIHPHQRKKENAPF